MLKYLYQFVSQVNFFEKFFFQFYILRYYIVLIFVFCVFMMVFSYLDVYVCFCCIRYLDDRFKLYIYYLLGLCWVILYQMFWVKQVRMILFGGFSSNWQNSSLIMVFGLDNLQLVQGRWVCFRGQEKWGEGKLFKLVFYFLLILDVFFFVG